MSTTSKTFEFRGGVGFSVTRKTVSFMGTDHSVAHVTLTPVLEHILRVRQGQNDYEGYIRFDIDNS